MGGLALSGVADEPLVSTLRGVPFELVKRRSRRRSHYTPAEVVASNLTKNLIATAVEHALESTPSGYLDELDRVHEQLRAFLVSNDYVPRARLQMEPLESPTPDQSAFRQTVVDAYAPLERLAHLARPRGASLLGAEVSPVCRFSAAEQVHVGVVVWVGYVLGEGPCFYAPSAHVEGPIRPR